MLKKCRLVFELFPGKCISLISIREYHLYLYLHASIPWTSVLVDDRDEVVADFEVGVSRVKWVESLLIGDGIHRHDGNHRVGIRQRGLRNDFLPILLPNALRRDQVSLGRTACK